MSRNMFSSHKWIFLIRLCKRGKLALWHLDVSWLVFTWETIGFWTEWYPTILKIMIPMTTEWEEFFQELQAKPPLHNSWRGHSPLVILHFSQWSWTLAPDHIFFLQLPWSPSCFCPDLCSFALFPAFLNVSVSLRVAEMIQLCLPAVQLREQEQLVWFRWCEHSDKVFPHLYEQKQCYVGWALMANSNVADETLAPYYGHAGG